MEYGRLVEDFAFLLWGGSTRRMKLSISVIEAGTRAASHYKKDTLLWEKASLAHEDVLLVLCDESQRRDDSEARALNVKTPAMMLRTLSWFEGRVCVPDRRHPAYFFEDLRYDAWTFFFLHRRKQTCGPSCSWWR